MYQLAICAFENTLQGDSPISSTKRITDQMHTSFFSLFLYFGDHFQNWKKYTCMHIQ